MRRLVALEPDVYEKLKSRKRQSTDKLVLSNLDQQMNEVLNSQRPDYEKIKLYNSILQKSRLYEKKSQGKCKEEGPISEDTLLRKYKKKARAKRVLKAVHDNHSIDWDVKGRLLVDDTPVPSSDIDKLLHSAVTKQDKNLPGWKEFNSILKWETI